MFSIIFSHVKRIALLLIVVFLPIQLLAQQVESIEIHTSKKYSIGSTCLLGFIDDTTLSVISNGIHYRLNTKTGNLSPVDLWELVSETRTLFETLFPAWKTDYPIIEPTIKAAGQNMNLVSPSVLYHRIFYKFKADNNYEMKLYSFIKSDSIEFLWSDSYSDLGVGIAMGENYFFGNDTITLIGTSLWSTDSDTSSYHLLKLKKSRQGFTIADTIEFPVDNEKIAWTETDDGFRYSDPDFRFYSTTNNLFISLGNKIFEYNNKPQFFFSTKDQVEAFVVKDSEIYSVENLLENYYFRIYNISQSSIVNSIVINYYMDDVLCARFSNNKLNIITSDKVNNRFLLTTITIVR